MAALLLETIGGGREPLGTRFDLKARSREYLRRGLVLSGALHLALLLVFLHLPGSDDEVLLRSYSRATEIFHPTVPPIVMPLPPASGSPRVHHGPGQFTPVREVEHPPVDLPAIDFPGPAVPPSGPGERSNENGSPDGPPSVSEPDPNRVYQWTDVEEQPVASFAPKPAYPEIARDMWITGEVIAQVLVQPDGAVARVRIVSGNRILADSVQETLIRWRFHPGKVHGRPVPVWVQIPVNFKL